MRFLVETGRFFVTALAVAITIPSAFAIVSLISREPFSFDAFLALGAISFVMAIIGGVIVGYPALWIAKMREWDSDLRTISIFGAIAGAFDGALMSIVFWQGNWDIVTAGIPIWAMMGSGAGLIAGACWYWLHRSDPEPMAHD